MDFLRSIGSSIGHIIGGFTGQNSDDELKKKQQQQQRAQQAAQQAQQPASAPQQASQPSLSVAPTKEVNLYQPNTLQKAPQPPKPAPPEENGGILNGLKNSVVKTVSLAPDAIRLGAAKITGNDVALKKAGADYSNDYKQSMVNPIVGSVENLGKIDLAGNAMVADAAAHAGQALHIPGSTELSKAVRPAIDQIQSVPWVKKTVDQKHSGASGLEQARTIAGGSTEDASNAISLVPAGKLVGEGLNVGKFGLRSLLNGFKSSAVQNLVPSAGMGTAAAINDPNNKTITDIGKDALVKTAQNEAIGTAIGTGLHTAGAGLSVLKKAPNELATGIVSTNENRAAEIAAEAAAQAEKAHRLEVAQAANAGMELDTPTYQRNQQLLTAGPDNSRLAVPLDPATPEGNVLLNADKPQIIPTGVELRPGTEAIPDRTVGILDRTNSRMPADTASVIPGMPATPEALVPTPGRNINDISAPRASANNDALASAREIAINKAKGAENVVPHETATSETPLDVLVQRASNPTGTDAQYLSDLNQIIQHTDADPALREQALNARDELIGQNTAPEVAPARPEPIVDQTPPVTPAVAEQARTEAPQPKPAPREAAPTVEQPQTITDGAGNVLTQDQLIKEFSRLSEIPPENRTVGEATQLDMTKNLLKKFNQDQLAETPNTVKPIDAQMTGTAKTGEFGKSEGQYARGQKYEKSSVEASKTRGEKEAANTSYQQVLDKIDENGGMNSADRDTLEALAQRFNPDTPERYDIEHLIGQYHTEAAQVLATIDKVIRSIANPKALTDRFVRKLYSTADDVKVADGDFKVLEEKNQAFTDARDAKNAAHEAFLNDDSQANYDAFLKANEAAENADMLAKTEEYRLASRLTKGTKDPKVIKFVKKLEQDSGVYTMDYVDSSFLASTRVMLNNFFNTAGVRAEEQAFGKVGAWLANKATGGNYVGGGSIKGARMGAGMGDNRLIQDAKLRAGANGNFLVKAIKNYTTTGNTLGERNIYASAYSGIYDYYRNQLKALGYSGEQLDRRAMVQALTDPEKKAAKYMERALNDNAMAGTIGGRQQTKIETAVADKLAEMTGNSKLAQQSSKAIMRLTLGFPTVIGRSLVGGAKRTLLGGPEAFRAGVNALKGGPKEKTAELLKQSVKEFGSGATMMGVGTALGAAGLISGSYPKDPDARAQWEREGKTEHSINIGGSWYSLPAALGVFALPLMIGANGGSNMKEGESAFNNFGPEAVGTLIDGMPIDSIKNFTDFVGNVKDGAEKPVEKYLATFGAGLVKAATPLGGLVAEVAKMFDPTANDTTQGDGIAQFVAKVQTGLPWFSNNVEDKVVDGNKIANPNPLELAAGAVTKEQTSGVQKSAEVKGKVDAGSQKLADEGALSDSVRSILDTKTQATFDRVKAGKSVQPGDLKKLLSGMTKGVSSDQNTRFLEDGNYDANLAVLNAKKDELAADPTAKKSEIAKYDTQIKRGEVYKAHNTPVADMEAYKKTSLSEWRNMGDPESDTYDPKMYQLLWNHDSMLAKAGVSDSTLDPSKNKYSAKTKGGSGGSGLSKVKSNTLGSTPDLKDISLGKLAPEKITDVNAKIPTIANVKPGELIKKRTISVSKA